MKVERIWAMPNHKTFQIKPIKELLERHFGGSYVDPFPFPFKTDALTYLKSFPTESVDKLAFDPPYSPRQLKEMYSNAGLAYDTKATYWSDMKYEITRIMKKGGKVISFGWNSMGIGEKRGFEKIEVLLVAHGGNHNDTICTVEIKK